MNMPSDSVDIGIFPGKIPELPAAEIRLELQGLFPYRGHRPPSLFVQEGYEDLGFAHGYHLSQRDDPSVFI